ncbi:DUF1572 family protein [Paenibacillus gansuensis]|uniref:DUF1572 family protein n=1 Tax=Paenibacillus gansuensis TaxID=306542 RepID=A0ABW5PE95_9BACL
MDFQKAYLQHIKSQFQYYKTLGERAIHQLEPEQLFLAANEDTNSIAAIVKHLWGNMLSRWTNFLTEDGEKSWRNRDAEFVNDLQSKEEVMEKWNEGWAVFLGAIDSIRPEQLTATIYIRNEGHSVFDAINRQLAHYPYHVGQIVYAAKLLKTGSWDSLSIPRNSSQSYNSAKFAQERRTKHFAEEELKRLENRSE